ncbi:uncharacterized protein LOC119673512 [Teleopsis dalmanni]|uniref:uncharacterized protein LOC119673512 n=1 Tax=Teleopsis dalmanni TaxID=139649 RepID=UPI000D32C256|nr:uncharacterized protein LOC119673512 [Teleopsis dalmanni]
MSASIFCPICQDTAVAIQLLPCAHPYCSDCIQEYIYWAESENRRKFCPLCNLEFLVTDEGFEAVNMENNTDDIYEELMEVFEDIDTHYEQNMILIEEMGDPIESYVNEFEMIISENAQMILNDIGDDQSSNDDTIIEELTVLENIDDNLVPSVHVSEFTYESHANYVVEHNVDENLSEEIFDFGNPINENCQEIEFDNNYLLDDNCNNEDYFNEHPCNENIDTFEPDTNEFDTDEFDAEEFDADEFDAEEFDTVEFGTDEFGTDEFGTDEFGTDEFGTDEFGTDEFGTDEFGTDEFGTDEFGTDEFGTDEFGTNEFGTNELEDVSFGSMEMIEIEDISFDDINFDYINFYDFNDEELNNDSQSDEGLVGENLGDDDMSNAQIPEQEDMFIDDYDEEYNQHL